MSLKTFATTLLILFLTGLPSTYGANHNGAETEVQNIRIGLTPGRTRVVFDLSGPGSYNLVTLENPDRVVVRIPDASSNYDHTKIPLQGTPIIRLNSAALSDGSLSYVLDIKGDVSSTLHALPPHEKLRGHRLVLDLNYAEIPAVDSTPRAVAEQEKAAGSGNEQLPPLITPQNATQTPNPVNSGSSGSWSGYLSLESRLFFDSPAFSEQDDQNVSVAFEPEYYLDWANGRQRFAFSPFFRYDANDDERTHADVRELYWRVEHEQLVFKAGLDVVFWGVTESQHLVDIINQSDLVENIDREDKLGQPMLNLDYMSNDWGTLQFYVLPYFRERTFPGEDGRLRIDPPVKTGDAQYDSSDEEEHIDFALRWSHFIGDWDVGLAHFTGTSREPLLLLSGSEQKERFVPLYLQIDQTSLDVQTTKGAWLWKLEAIYNDNKLEDYFASVAGFEYTYFGVAGTPADIGLLLEYNYDERDERSTTALQDDIYVGVRLTGNDIAGTRLLAGVIVDADNGSTFGNIEAVRRFGERWTITAEARIFSNIDRDDPIYFFRDDDYIELQFARFF